MAEERPNSIEHKLRIKLVSLRTDLEDIPHGKVIVDSLDLNVSGALIAMERCYLGSVMMLYSLFHSDKDKIIKTVPHTARSLVFNKLEEIDKLLLEGILDKATESCGCQIKQVDPKDILNIWSD